MSGQPSVSREIARRLVAHAAMVLPKGRDDWGRAMLTEIDQLPHGFAVLHWAAGCLFASYYERVRIMKLGNLGTVNFLRVALTLEMLACFVLPTCLLLGLPFVLAFFDASPPWGPSWSALLLTTSVIGPLGLFLAFRFLILERRQMSRGLAIALLVLAAWTLVGNAFFALSLAAPGYSLRAIVLQALLPALGATHLIYLARVGRRGAATFSIPA